MYHVMSRGDRREDIFLDDVDRQDFLKTPQGSTHRKGNFSIDRLALNRLTQGMPRNLRVEYPGAMYHVMSRGDRREDIFLDDVDRRDFGKIGAWEARSSERRCWQKWKVSLETTIPVGCIEKQQRPKPSGSSLRN